MNSNIETAYIGTIIFDDALNEAEVSGKTNRPSFKSIGECKVEVYSNEGNIPHFHMYNLSNTFNTCICIYSANYFSHGNKYTDKLSSSQRKQLDKWLLSIPKDPISNMTNWAGIVFIWEHMNPDCNFSNSRKVSIQPKYSDMIDYRDI